MYFKYIFKEMKENRLMDSIIIFQMLIVFICTMSAVSIASYFYNYYDNFSNFYNAEGDIYRLGVILNGSKPIESTKIVEDNLKSAEVSGMYIPWATYFNSSNEQMEYNTFSYDKELINAFTPKLKSGRWINPDRKDGVIEAVISDSEYNLSVGDEIMLCDGYLFQPDCMLKTLIVGVVEDGARVVGISYSESGDLADYRDIYVDYYEKKEDFPLIMTSIDSINAAMEIEGNHSVQRSISGLMFVKYDKGISIDDIAYNERFISGAAQDMQKKNLSVIKKNSINSIKTRLYSIFPIFICVLILEIISGMCNFAISIKKHMREYTIFGICGMPWNKAAHICIFKSIFMSAASLVMAIGCVFVGVRLGAVKETTISLGVIPVVACLVVGAVYVLISAIMPIALVKGTSLCGELKEND